MTLLIASLLALGVGPLAYRLTGERQRGLSLLDGFVVVAISGLIVLGILPEAVAVAGPWVVLLGIAGLLGPNLLEHRLQGAVARTHQLAVGAALVGVALHALLDGAALHLGAEDDHLLPTAVILHRIPVGLVVWWLLRPAAGRGVATGALLGIAAVTVIGYFVGLPLVERLEAPGIAAFQVFVAGTLLHVVLHRSPVSSSDSAGSKALDGIGGLAGIALLVVLFGHHATGHGGHAHGGAEHASIFPTFVALALESAAPLLLAYLGAGLLGEFMPASSMGWLGRGGSLAQALRGTAVGLPIPVCSCGTLPLYQGLVRRGAPATAAMAFLIATPELGLDAVLISIPLLGGEMTIARVVAAAVVALAVGVIVGRTVPRMAKHAADGSEACCEDDCDAEGSAPSDASRSLAARGARSVRIGFGEVVDQTAAWILFGLALAAIVQPLLQAEWIAALPSLWVVPIFALLGLPTYVCASGATPLVAVLIGAGVSPGAALAFLLTGPATNISTVGVLSRLHGRRVALVFAATTTSIAIGLGYALDAFWPIASAVDVSALKPESASVFQWIALVSLGAVFVVSLLRLGARRFFVENLFPESDHAHGHDHDHGAGGDDHARSESEAT